MESVRIAVIGGSGLYKMPEITDMTSYDLDTPYGKPSAPVIVGTLRGKRIAFLPRHGIGHTYTPSTVPYRANIYALKLLGVRQVVAVNACGSLREDYAPGHIVIPDQLIDYTKHDRGRTFFDTGLVAHVSVADPFCAELSSLTERAVHLAGGTVHSSSTFVIVEGPRFSTRGESNIFRNLGCDIVGMTTCPESFLAREAEMCYATMAHVTDYDVWHTTEAPVTVDMVLETLHHNLHIAQQAVAELTTMLPDDHDCACHHALDNAVMTDKSVMSSDMLSRLQPIVGRLFSQG